MQAVVAVPTTRIDIAATPLATPPDNCRLLQLPTELRLLILELVLAHHTVQLWLKPMKHASESGPDLWCVRSTVSSPDVEPDAESLESSITQTCRQLYLEGMPLVFQKNTLEFDIRYFVRIISEGVGLHWVADFRHLVLRCTPPSDDKTWLNIFKLLHAMKLESLVIDCEVIYNVGSLVLTLAPDSRWGRRLLAIRGLQYFSIKLPEPLRFGDPERYLDDGVPIRLANKLAAEYQALMVGPDAEENYQAFLKEHPE
uniref:DUF7730 domain-containing protein n=1 Tax=Mycena chlorophos TaxID=658473 RepID=A0ABQ0LD07_MYCCL|nr:predicted protein [Mycena chlorophos]